MRARSILWTLLRWYSLMLTTAVVAFGATVYVLVRDATFTPIDRELAAHAHAIAGAIETHSDDSFDLELSDEYWRWFQQEGADAPYYVVWRNREQVDASDPLLAVPFASEPGPRGREGRREVAADGPSRMRVLVGRGTSDERARLRELLGLLLAAGVAIAGIALGGGWLLTARALVPIRRMTETASAIGEQDLSRRIDVGATERELSDLARTLNGAFDRLQEAFERQLRFTADASHELRTPVSIVLSNAELALRRERTPDEYKEALATCVKAARRMRAVVDGLLTLARADAGESVRRDAVDIAALGEETVTMLRPIAEERRVTLEFQAEPATVAGDPERLREVVANLVSNGIRYNREGGRVTVSIRRASASITVAVKDTGIGIPVADQPHVFERFYRVDKARSRDQGGSGLGLSITRWIVESHQGTIGFESVEGEGTTFTVTLPASEPVVAAAGTGAPAP